MTNSHPDQPLVLVPNRSFQQLTFAESFGVLDGAKPAPRVEVFSLWVSRCLETLLLLEGKASPLVPSRLRYRRLWEEAIRDASKGQPLADGSVRSTAMEAMEADRLSAHWLSPGAGMPRTGGADEGFPLWRRQVHEQLRARGWEDPAGQMRKFAEILEGDEPLPVSLPAHIVQRGFIEITPLEHRIFRALEGRGVKVGKFESQEPGDDSPSLQAFPDLESEVRAAAAWAKQASASGAQRIAVVVNEFRSLRPLLQRAFEQEFHPELIGTGLVPEQPGYHLHGGTSLLDHPLISAALDLLELSIGGVRRERPFSLISRWVLSPAWAGAETETAARAMLELRLRTRERYEPSLVFVAEQAPEAGCELLVERIGRLPGSDVAPTSAERFFAWLSHWGWPGPFARGRQGRRAVDGLRGALESLEFSGDVDDESALMDLRQLCRENQLPGAGGVLTPVQVIPVEDVVDHHFDGLRFINVHADNWPPPVRSNRLLPFSAAPSLPRADMQRQYEHFHELQGAVLRAAPTCTISRSLQVDGVDTSISPLLKKAQDLETGQAQCHSGLARIVWPDAGGSESVLGRDQLQEIDRQSAPGLAPDVLPLKSVVSVLNLQSACPWAAFLVHRLGAKFPDTPGPFADARFSGSLVHSALDFLYRPHIDKDTLPGNSEIAPAIEAAMQAQHAKQRLAPAALAAERRRLELLLADWLQTEAERPLGSPHLLEDQRDAEMAGFTFQVRLDRVDNLDDGVLVLDYKTGSLPTKSWDHERPIDLQLPLYAVLGQADEVPPIGIGLLSLRQSEMKRRIYTGSNELQGAGVVKMGEKDSCPDWASYIAHWGQVIPSLFGEYRNGVADFTVYQPKALDYSGLELLLRLGNDDEEEDNVRA